MKADTHWGPVKHNWLAELRNGGMMILFMCSSSASAGELEHLGVLALANSASSMSSSNHCWVNFVHPSDYLDISEVSIFGLLTSNFSSCTTQPMFLRWRHLFLWTRARVWCYRTALHPQFISIDVRFCSGYRDPFSFLSLSIRVVLLPAALLVTLYV